TASHSRRPSSSGVPPVRTVTGERSALRRSRCCARSAAPSTVDASTTFGAGFHTGDADDVASTGFAIGFRAGAAPGVGPGPGAGFGAGAGAGSVASLPHAITRSSGQIRIARWYHGSDALHSGKRFGLGLVTTVVVIITTAVVTSPGDSMRLTPFVVAAALAG